VIRNHATQSADKKTQKLKIVSTMISLIVAPSSIIKTHFARDRDETRRVAVNAIGHVRARAS
jgi:hypothetical protein